MTPVRVALPVLIILSLAASTPFPAHANAPDGTADADPDHHDTVLTFYGCSALYGIVPVSEVEAAALMPPGLEPMPFLTTGTAGVSVLGQHCARVTSNTGIDVTDYTELLYLLLADPAPEYEIPGAVHGLTFYFKTNVPAIASIYDAWRVGSPDATDLLFESTRDTLGFPWIGQTTAPADGTALQIATQLNGHFGGVPFRLYGVDESGHITNAADYDIFAGRSGLGGVHVTFPLDAPIVARDTAGIGSTYWWDDDVVTQTMGYTAL